MEFQFSFLNLHTLFMLYREVHLLCNVRCHFSIDSETIIIIIGTLKSETASKSPQMQRGNDFERSEFTVALYSTITHTNTHTLHTCRWLAEVVPEKSLT